MVKKLYVGNLSEKIKTRTLRTLFSEDGRQVLNVEIPIDRSTGRPRGFAFVEMSSEEEAEAARKALDGREVHGQAMKVGDATDGGDKAGGEGAGRSGRRRLGGGASGPPSGAGQAKGFSGLGGRRGGGSSGGRR